MLRAAEGAGRLPIPPPVTFTGSLAVTRKFPQLRMILGCRALRLSAVIPSEVSRVFALARSAGTRSRGIPLALLSSGWGIRRCLFFVGARHAVPAKLTWLLVCRPPRPRWRVVWSEPGRSDGAKRLPLRSFSRSMSCRPHMLGYLPTIHLGDHAESPCGARELALEN